MPSPLIEQLRETPGTLVLTDENRETVLNSDETLCLFFTENPARFPESNDVAVVLPELMQAMPEQFRTVVVDQSIERSLQKTYGFRVWPALVFVRGGQYLGTIEKIRDWSEYLEDIPSILNNKPGRAPGIGIAVKTETSPAT